MRFRVVLNRAAQAQRAVLAPHPKRRVNEVLEAMETDPYGRISIRLTLDEDDEVHRARAGGYRILFRPGPGSREVTVFRIARRAVAYEGFERRRRSQS